MYTGSLSSSGVCIHARIIEFGDLKGWTLFTVVDPVGYGLVSQKGNGTGKIAMLE